jgi:hypothetical protein
MTIQLRRRRPFVRRLSEKRRRARIAGVFAAGAATGGGALFVLDRASRRRGRREPDDATLARKVETELFRDPEVPKGQISVNAQRGVVQLRGEVPSAEMLTELVERAREINGVRDVESLLHLHGVDAPMHR